MKKTPKWVAPAALIGAAAGAFYLLTNQRQVRGQTYVTAQRAAGALGVELPAGFGAAVLPETPFSSRETQAAIYGAEIADMLGRIGRPRDTRTSVANLNDTVGGGRFGVQYDYGF